MNAQDIQTTTARGNPGVAAAFRPVTVLILLIVGIMSFGAFITLSGFQGDLETKDHSGRAHALSKSPNGFAGIVKLLRADGLSVEGLRSETVPATIRDAHVVVTVPTPYSARKLEEFDSSKPILVVLPKWRTRKSLKTDGGTIRLDPYSTAAITRALEPVFGILAVKRAGFMAQDRRKAVWDIRTDAVPPFGNARIDNPQTLAPEGLDPIISAKGLGVILGRKPGTDIYILSDPDFLNNSGLKTFEGALLARSIIEEFSPDASPVLFDLTLHGLGSNQNLVKTMLTPPFLAATLCFLATGLMLAWRAFTRFGRPQLRGRIYATGKQALADNSADMIRLAGREANMAPGYVALIRKLTARALGLPKTLSEVQLTESLDRMAARAKTDNTLTELSRKAENTHTNAELMTLAQTLDKWRQEMTHDRK